MEYKFNFKTEEEKEQLIKDNGDLYFKEVCYCLEPNNSFIIFTDVEPIIEPTLEDKVNEQAVKISILECENNILKLENADIMFALMNNNLI